MTKKTTFQSACKDVETAMRKFKHYDQDSIDLVRAVRGALEAAATELTEQKRRVDFAEEEAAITTARLYDAWPHTEAANEEFKRLRGHVERLRNALIEVNRIITVPAAEYVPAIPQAWQVIEEALTPKVSPKKA